LLTGIEHQSIQRFPLIQQLITDALHLDQIGQIRSAMGHLAGRRTSGDQLCKGLLAALRRAAEERELMATASQSPGSLQPDAGTRSSDQDPLHANPLTPTMASAGPESPPCSSPAH